MTIPVLCNNCHALARMKRTPFAWATFCAVCGFAEISYDKIILGKEEDR